MFSCKIHDEIISLLCCRAPCTRIVNLLPIIDFLSIASVPDPWPAAYVVLYGRLSPSDHERLPSDADLHGRDSPGISSQPILACVILLGRGALYRKHDWAHSMGP